MENTNNDQDMLFNSNDGAEPASQPNPPARQNNVERQDINPIPVQQVRRELRPHDTHLQDTLVFENFRKNSLASLQRDNTIFQDLNFCYLYVQILCLIVSNKYN